MLKVMKNNLRKILLSFFIFFVSSLFVNVYAFNDMDKTHWAYNYINQLEKDGVVVGYPDGNYRPEQFVTRAEFATMVVKALNQGNYEVSEITNFSDVDTGFWGYDNIQRAVYLDVMKGLPNGTFLPQNHISKAQAIAIVVSSLKTDDMTESEAKSILNNSYSDVENVESWALIPTGKAKSMGLIVDVPGFDGKLALNENATRAELAAYLSNMIEWTKKIPNEKIEETMKRKADNGYVVQGVQFDGKYAIIPKGTLLPVAMNQKVSTQTFKNTQELGGYLPQNIISEDYYLLLDEKSQIYGQSLQVKKAWLFIRNGKLVIETRNIRTPIPQVSYFWALSEQYPTYKSSFTEFLRKIFKGAKIEVQKDEVINVKLLEDIRIDLTTGKIVHY